MGLHSYSTHAHRLCDHAAHDYLGHTRVCERPVLPGEGWDTPSASASETAPNALGKRFRRDRKLDGDLAEGMD
ncbi:hypothetical protein A6R68_21601 [Neotoma lepida]|uniref:Uncharacterized protein n=1 Tax=Neotoma lepida TaxID=56216 RepID=A0A1A6HP31_NEOLE|nr:hypothetical protein A6R68_21601 [Neotoma lepida]